MLSTSVERTVLTDAASSSQELHLVVRAFQFLLKSLDCFPLVENLLRFLIDINMWDVVDFLGPSSVVEGGNVFINKHVKRRQTCNHQCVAVSAKTLLENSCELAFPVRNVLDFFLLLSLTGLSRVVSESCDYLPQGKKRLVDFYCFFECL